MGALSRLSPEVRIPITKGIFQAFIEHLSADLQHEMGTLLGEHKKVGASRLGSRRSRVKEPGIPRIGNRFSIRSTRFFMLSL